MEKCCSCGSGCCTPKKKRTITIDFLYLDLSVCERCQGTESVLEEAIRDAKTVLNAADIDVVVNKVNITTKEQAIKYRLESSPTIRIDGHDIAVETKESLCECCGDLCGEDVDCRVWTYQGDEYTVPPKAMILNALLQAVYSDKQPDVEKEYTLPQNLASFFDAMEKRKNDG